MFSRRFVPLALCALLGACAIPPGAEGSAANAHDGLATGLVATPSASKSAALRGEATDLLEDADAEKANAGERMVIHRGAMTVEVARPDDAIAQFAAKVREWGGYLAAQHDKQVTVRLPAARFDDGVALLRGMGRVVSESRTADDVTKQYLDVGIRLENARRSRDRLLALLEKATAVEDILKIEEQLRRLTEEIERMEGEMKFLADQVAMATLAATFQSVAAQPPGRQPRSRFSWINAVGVQRVLDDF